MRQTPLGCSSSATVLHTTTESSSAYDSIPFIRTRQGLKSFLRDLRRRVADWMSHRDMSSSTAASSSSLKTTNAYSQSTSSAHFQAGLTNTTDSGFQRRAGSSGSFGAGSSSRQTSTARKNQPLRKQHKAQRRARLADEDAMAESVRYTSPCSPFDSSFVSSIVNEFCRPP